jgi:hypothetical protein
MSPSKPRNLWGQHSWPVKVCPSVRVLKLSMCVCGRTKEAVVGTNLSCGTAFCRLISGNDQNCGLVLDVRMLRNLVDVWRCKVQIASE